MLMQFVGISEMSFDTKEGNHIEGTNLYLLTQNPTLLLVGIKMKHLMNTHFMVVCRLFCQDLMIRLR